MVTGVSRGAAAMGATPLAEKWEGAVETADAAAR